MSDTRTIVLIGLSGAGKSTVARLLSERLGARALDLDAAIESDAQASVAQIFAREGEAGFRRREVERLSSVLRDAPAVLACGGGVILEPEARALLSAGCRVVWLE
jgi:shikimate kinase